MAKQADSREGDTPRTGIDNESGAAATTPGRAAEGAHADVASLSYEQARDELVDIVARLESGSVGLEESMGLWQRGEALADHCAGWLDRAEARITAEE